MEGILDMNNSQNTPHEESLKRTMLDHEIVFKKQVHELHRLYAMQKSLITGGANFLPMKRTFAESHTVGSTRFILDDPFLHKDQDFRSRIHQIPLDLRLSTSNFSDDDDLIDEEVNLSLTIGRSSNKRSRIAGKTLKNKIVIDLEESIETRSNEDAQPVYFLNQHNRDSMDHLMQYPSRGLTESLMNGANLHQESCRMTESLMTRNNLDQDHVTKDPTESLMNCERSSFSEGSMNLDLNRDLPDKSSFHSIEPAEPYPSSGSSLAKSCGPIGKFIKSKPCTIDLESVPEPSSDLTDEKTIDIEKEDSDHTLRKAALLLISMSTSNQDSETKSEIKNDNQNKKKTISSIDSYESLVLKLEESSIDEDSATSRVFEMDGFEKRESGIKLRRGRRMKDFQKDVLPMLSSLKRHEIWEDINILEGVIRSREYKQMHKAKTGDTGNGFTPVKSKRSKVNYGGRRSCLRKKKS